jgi:serine acetyltransferase
MTTSNNEVSVGDNVNIGANVVIAAENPLKQMLLEYVGNKYATEEDEGEFEVTVQMIVDNRCLSNQVIFIRLQEFMFIQKMT